MCFIETTERTVNWVNKNVVTPFHIPEGSTLRDFGYGHYTEKFLEREPTYLADGELPVSEESDQNLVKRRLLP